MAKNFQNPAAVQPESTSVFPASKQYALHAVPCAAPAVCPRVGARHGSCSLEPAATPPSIGDAVLFFGGTTSTDLTIAFVKRGTVVTSAPTIVWKAAADAAAPSARFNPLMVGLTSNTFLLAGGVAAVSAVPPATAPTTGAALDDGYFGEITVGASGTDGAFTVSVKWTRIVKIGKSADVFNILHANIPSASVSANAFKFEAGAEPHARRSTFVRDKAGSSLLIVTPLAKTALQTGRISVTRLYDYTAASAVIAETGIFSSSATAWPVSDTQALSLAAVADGYAFGFSSPSAETHDAYLHANNDSWVFEVETSSDGKWRPSSDDAAAALKFSWTNMGATKSSPSIRGNPIVASTGSARLASTLKRNTAVVTLWGGGVWNTAAIDADNTTTDDDKKITDNIGYTDATVYVGTFNADADAGRKFSWHAKYEKLSTSDTVKPDGVLLMVEAPSLLLQSATDTSSTYLFLSDDKPAVLSHTTPVSYLKSDLGGVAVSELTATTEAKSKKTLLSKKTIIIIIAVVVTVIAIGVGGLILFFALRKKPVTAKIAPAGGFPQPAGGFPQPAGGFPQPAYGFPQPAGGFPQPAYG